MLQWGLRVSLLNRLLFFCCFKNRTYCFCFVTNPKDFVVLTVAFHVLSHLNFFVHDNKKTFRRHVARNVVEWKQIKQKGIPSKEVRKRRVGGI